MSKPIRDPLFLPRSDFQKLLDSLRDHRYRVVGPVARDGAIVLDDIRTVDDLPIGWTEEQNAATYRLVKRGDDALFGYTLGPQSWKQYLFPPVLTLWQAARTNGTFKVTQEAAHEPPVAFLGVRSCELAAIAIQDRVFLEGEFVDQTYAARRKGAFIVAVSCGQAGGTCFCASMGTGPRASAGFDLALTEVLSAGEHYFVVEIGSGQGKKVIAPLGLRAATADELAMAAHVVAETAAHMGRTIDISETRELLYKNTEHPHWDEVAQRCLSCANCTMVCPTCFCSTVEDVTDLAGKSAARIRKWDSCFTSDFTYIHGGSIRNSIKSRARQRMMHKFATWIDQFGTVGCVGCGRCITWCPVGIDVTEEMRAIRETSLPAVQRKRATRAKADPAPAGTGE